MDWTDALVEAIEDGGNSTYHPYKHLTIKYSFRHKSYTIASRTGRKDGLKKEQISAVLARLDADDDYWTFE